MTQSTMQPNGQQRRRRETPESRFYDTVKGCPVIIVLDVDGLAMNVRLLWVDRYSIGIRTESGDEVLLNKRSIRTIKRGHHANNGGATL